MSTTVLRTVDTPLARYRELEQVWNKNRAMLGGERLVKEYDDDTQNPDFLLLPFSEDMTEKQYQFFKSEAELPGICTIFARMLISGLLRKKPVMELPEEVPEDAYEWLMSSFTRDGGAMSPFLSEVLWEEMISSRAWIYVDHPKIPVDNKMTVEQRGQIKPYAMLWKASLVINWETTVNELGAGTLSRVCLRGITEEQDELSEFHRIEIPTVWVHEIKDGLYQVRVFKDHSKRTDRERDTDWTEGGTHWEEDETLDQFYIANERLTFIPAWPANGCIEPQEPQMTPLIEKEKHLYNKMSRRNHLLLGAATYTPYLIGDLDEEQFNKAIGSGLGTAWNLPKGTEIGILQTPTDALDNMEKTIAAGIEEMAKLGIRMLTPETDQSGVALEIRNAAQTAQLGSLNERISNTVSKIISFMIKWRYDIDLPVDKITFSLSEDFNPIPLGADWLRLVTEWYQEGLIPRSIWLQIVKSNDIVDPDYDDEEGQIEINADTLLNRADENSVSGETL